MAAPSNLLTPENFQKIAQGQYSNLIPGSTDSSDGNKSLVMKLREEILILDNTVKNEKAALQEEFAKLDKTFKAIDKQNPQAVNTYKADFDAYSERKKQFTENKSKLEKMQKELDEKVAALPPAPKPTEIPTGGSGGSVVIYSTMSCPACTMAKAYMMKKGVPYIEKDIQKSPQAMEEWQKFGSRGVPVIVINGTVIKGFNAQACDQALAARK